MTVGEHLEELRWRVLRSVIALLIACIACIWPARYLLEWISRPVVLALRRHGQADSFLATSPVEVLLVYIKVVLIAGVVIAAPYVLYQLWGFVGSGLYKHEKEWARRLVPVSVGLFLAGVAFMYAFVLIVSLNFLVGFGSWLPMPDASPTAMEKLLLGGPPAVRGTTQPVTQPAQVPALADDPANPPSGSIWFNATDGRLKLRGADETYSVQLARDAHRALVSTHFRMGEYLSFVLVMTIAFGAAFQMPLVVVFLARSGIVPVQIMREYRRVVILIIVVIAGILAPPDLFSHLLLSGPMILLFELGLLLARRSAAKQTPAGARR